MACDCDGPQSTLAISPRAQGGRTRIPALPAGARLETLTTLERVEWKREEYAVLPRRRMRTWFRRHDDMQMGDWAPACAARSEEHTSELQSLMRNSYAIF